MAGDRIRTINDLEGSLGRSVPNYDNYNVGMAGSAKRQGMQANRRAGASARAGRAMAREQMEREYQLKVFEQRRLDRASKRENERLSDEGRLRRSHEGSMFDRRSSAASAATSSKRDYETGVRRDERGNVISDRSEAKGYLGDEKAEAEKQRLKQRAEMLGDKEVEHKRNRETTLANARGQESQERAKFQAKAQGEQAKAFAKAAGEAEGRANKDYDRAFKAVKAQYDAMPKTDDPEEQQSRWQNFAQAVAGLGERRTALIKKISAARKGGYGGMGSSAYGGQGGGDRGHGGGGAPRPPARRPPAPPGGGGLPSSPMPDPRGGPGHLQPSGRAQDGSEWDSNKWRQEFEETYGYGPSGRGDDSVYDPATDQWRDNPDPDNVRVLRARLAARQDARRPGGENSRERLYDRRNPERITSARPELPGGQPLEPPVRSMGELLAEKEREETSAANRKLGTEGAESIAFELRMKREEDQRQARQALARRHSGPDGNPLGTNIPLSEKDVTNPLDDDYEFPDETPAERGKREERMGDKAFEEKKRKRRIARAQKQREDKTRRLREANRRKMDQAKATGPERHLKQITDVMSGGVRARDKRRRQGIREREVEREADAESRVSPQEKVYRASRAGRDKRKRAQQAESAIIREKNNEGFEFGETESADAKKLRNWMSSRTKKQARREAAKPKKKKKPRGKNLNEREGWVDPEFDKRRSANRRARTKREKAESARKERDYVAKHHEEKALKRIKDRQEAAKKRGNKAAARKRAKKKKKTGREKVIEAQKKEKERKKVKRQVELDEKRRRANKRNRRLRGANAQSRSRR